MTPSPIILLIDKLQAFSFAEIPLVYYFIGLSLILPKIPYIGKVFNIINTLIHEFGHAFMSLLLQGTVHSIEIFGDTSGNATTQTKSKFAAFLVSISGYLFASSFAWLSFYLYYAGLGFYFIAGLSILFFIILLLWVRNLFGLIWILLFCGLNALLLYYGTSEWVDRVALFYATVLLTESVMSTLVLFYLSLFKHKESGDAYNLQKFTHIPAFIWACGFVSYAGLVAYQIFINFIL